MNIGQLMRTVLGEAKADNAKALELKVGQIVRGVVLQLLDGQEAMVQIGGVPVRAKLEAALQPGRSTMLQVQPDAGGGTVVLKPVDAQAAPLPDETLRELARMMGLPDRKWGLELVRDLRRDGFALTKEAAQSFQQAAAERPAGAPAETWMQAAAAAFKRGLPMTGASVSALHQALFGKPAGELLETLRAQLAALPGAAAGAPEGAAPGAAARGALPEAAARVQALLAEGAALLRAGERAAGAPQAPPAGGSGAAAAAPAQAAQPGAAAPAAGASAAPPPGAAGAGERAAGAPQAQQPAGGSGAAAAAPAQAAQPGAAAPAAGASAAPPPGAAGAGERAAGAAQAPPAGPTAGASWLGQLLKWLGVEHEKQLLQLPGGGAQGRAGEAADAAPPAAAASRPAAEAPPSPAGQPPAAGERLAGLTERAAAMLQGGGPSSAVLHAEEQARAAVPESMKSALMQLAAADDAPPALRETAQQLVQHITGQQLLLAPERSGALLSHVTLFVPFRDADGGQTATVHIQSRRGRKGELDAANCRLLFDLRMKRLGDTLVDVHVVERFVSLSVWNDHRAAGELIEGGRDEIAEALAGAGFQLLSLGAKPYPGEAAGKSAEAAGAAGGAKLPEPAGYEAKPYKGVDYRI